MPYTTDSTFKSEKNKAANKPIWLYTIEDYDGASNDLHLAEHDADVIYNGVTYTKFAIMHEEIADNNQGEIDTIKVRVGNVNRSIQAYLEAYDWRNKRVIITQVWANQLADANAYLQFIYNIDSYASNQDSAEFTLTPKHDVLTVQLPARVYSRNVCCWIFKSTECGYAGAETSCTKTKTRCKQLDNFVRFGAFPSTPVTRVFT